MLEETRIKTSGVHRERQRFRKDDDDIDQGQEEEVAEKGEGSQKMEGSLFYFFCKIITLSVARVWFDMSYPSISHLLLAVTQLTEWKEH